MSEGSRRGRPIAVTSPRIIAEWDGEDWIWPRTMKHGVSEVADLHRFGPAVIALIEAARTHLPDVEQSGVRIRPDCFEDDPEQCGVELHLRAVDWDRALPLPLDHTSPSDETTLRVFVRQVSSDEFLVEASIDDENNAMDGAMRIVRLADEAPYDVVTEVISAESTDAAIEAVAARLPGWLEATARVAADMKALYAALPFARSIHGFHDAQAGFIRTTYRELGDLSPAEALTRGRRDEVMALARRDDIAARHRRALQEAHDWQPGREQEPRP